MTIFSCIGACYLKNLFKKVHYIWLRRTLVTVTLVGIGKSVTVADCHSIGLFSVWEGPFLDQWTVTVGNCHCNRCRCNWNYLYYNYESLSYFSEFIHSLRNPPMTRPIHHSANPPLPGQSGHRGFILPSPLQLGCPNWVRFLRRQRRPRPTHRPPRQCHSRYCSKKLLHLGSKVNVFGENSTHARGILDKILPKGLQNSRPNGVN